MGKRDFFEEEKMSKTIKLFTIVLAISVIVFIGIFTMYNKKLKEQADLSVLELGAINSVVPNENTISTSTTQDKGKNDVATQNTTNTVTNSTKNTSSNTSSNNTNAVKNNDSKDNNAKQTNTANTTKENANNVAENKTANTNVESVTNTENSNAENSNTELKFIAPVAGEISKDFADDTLAYSNTLEEWTTHLGIDIKAERTSVVVASEAGKVESIKNDPRYGLTITIDHGNNYKTVYSNLLTTEFVQSGETVEKGQTIATVGDTASFEVLDEPHLHFEMYLDGKAVNPTLYFK